MTNHEFLSKFGSLFLVPSYMFVLPSECLYKLWNHFWHLSDTYDPNFDFGCAQHQPVITVFADPKDTNYICSHYVLYSQNSVFPPHLFPTCDRLKHQNRDKIINADATPQKRRKKIAEREQKSNTCSKQVFFHFNWNVSDRVIKNNKGKNKCQLRPHTK